jgi:hypothetical protein
MDENHNRFEQIIKRKDELTPSPGERAKLIWDILMQSDVELTTWDLLCGTTEILARLSIPIPWLEPDAKRLALLVYSAHYNSDELPDSACIRDDGATQEGSVRPNEKGDGVGHSDSKPETYL